MAKLTSSAANKLLKKKEKELSDLLRDQENKSTFRCSLNEKVEDVRPTDYDLKDVLAKYISLQSDIRVIKHAINVFNTTATLPDFSPLITVDQALILLPQLNEKYRIYNTLASNLPKERASVTPTVIDYIMTNYDPATAKAVADDTYEKIQKVQTALDKLNNSVVGVEIPDDLL